MSIKSMGCWCARQSLTNVHRMTFIPDAVLAFKCWPRTMQVHVHACLAGYEHAHMHMHISIITWCSTGCSATARGSLLGEKGLCIRPSSPCSEASAAARLPTAMLLSSMYDPRACLSSCRSLAGSSRAASCGCAGRAGASVALSSVYRAAALAAGPRLLDEVAGSVAKLAACVACMRHRRQSECGISSAKACQAGSLDEQAT